MFKSRIEKLLALSIAIVMLVTCIPTYSFAKETPVEKESASSEIALNLAETENLSQYDEETEEIYDFGIIGDITSTNEANYMCTIEFANTESDVEKFKIELAENGSSRYMEVAEVYSYEYVDYGYNAQLDDYVYYYSVDLELPEEGEYTVRIVPVVEDAFGDAGVYTFEYNLVVDKTTLNSVAKTAADTVTVKWSAVDGATSYEVWHKKGANGTWGKVASVSNNTYKHTGVKIGVTHYYKIKVVNNTAKSEFSNSKSVFVRVGKVTGLKTQTKSYTSIKVSWNKVKGAAGYKVYRWNASKGKYVLVKTVVGNAKTTWTQTGLKKNFSYTYKVKAYTNVNGNLSLSENYSASSVGVAGVLKASINSITSTTGSITIKWNYAKYASGYEIYRAKGNGSFSKIKTIKNGNTKAFTNSGLKSSTKYRYKIRSYKWVNGKKLYGSYSAVKSISTKQLKPAYSVVMSSSTDYYCGAVVMYIKNNATKPMTIINDNPWLCDNDYYSYDRDLDLAGYSIDGDRIYTASSVTIPAGGSRYIIFDVEGDDTWYDYKSTVYFSFKFNNKQYRASSSYYYGHSYWLD